MKDLSELHLAQSANSPAIKAVVARMIAAARPASAMIEERRRVHHADQVRRTLEASAGLLRDPRLLTKMGRCLQQNGFAGDLRNAKLVFLALVSSVLLRLVNLHIDGPSAAGKSFAVDRVLEMVPEEFVYRLTASSERAFVYNEESFEHRYIVVREAAGLQMDGIAGTIMRTVAWEGCVEYDTVEKGPDGAHRTRRIRKSGPTGIITTSVKSLNHELATRFLTATVRDDPDQTKLIVKEAGRQAADRPARVDVTAYVAALRWVRLAGKHEVVIPYAKVLAELVDPGEVRVRRDFPQTLSLIESSAILHQQQRGVGAAGRIIATVVDYAIVYHLVSGALASAKGELTQAQRAAVLAVWSLYKASKGETAGVGMPTSVTDVAKALGIDRSAASRRLERPLALGFVVNREDRPNRPAKLVPGDPLPSPKKAIPAPAELRKAIFEAEEAAKAEAAKTEAARAEHNQRTTPPPGSPRKDCTPALQSQKGRPALVALEISGVQSGVQSPLACSFPAPGQDAPPDGNPSRAMHAKPPTARGQGYLDKANRPACRRAVDSGGPDACVPQDPEDLAAFDLVRVLVLAHEARYPPSTDLGLPPPTFSGKDGWDGAVEAASPEGMIDLGRRLVGLLRPSKVPEGGPAESGIPPGGSADIAVLVPSASSLQPGAGIPGEVDELI
jgi:hypothetical protein